MPRTKLFDEKNALKQALDLFWEKGYEATSLSDLTNELGIGKGSFYDTFGSKRNLFNRCLYVYQSSSFEVLDRIFTENSDVVEGIRIMLENHTDMMLTDTSHKGCFIANSTAELADDVMIKAFLEEHNQLMRFRLVNFFANSSYSDDSEALADLVLTHLTGISLMSKFIEDSSRFYQANKLFMKVFEL